MSSHLSRNQKNSYRTGLIYLFSGILLLLIFSGWRFHQARVLSFWSKELPQPAISKTGEIPVLIKSFPLGVNIKIKESNIQNGVWQIFSDAASHLESSARIGEGGNIIIYGHNKNEVLGPIRWAKEGEKIELVDATGKEYYYEVVKVEIVDPSNLTYILPTNEETLTVYTCIGFMDSERLILVAKKV